MRAATLTLTLVIAAAPAAAPQRYRIRGTVSVVQEPCHGGAAVRPEEYERGRVHAPLQGEKLTLYAGRARAGKPVLHFETNASARFDIRLAAGTYCLVQGEQGAAPVSAPGLASGPKAAAGSYMDPDCLQNLARACDATLEVRARDQNNVEVIISRRCSAQWAHPCWRGPMPP